jgi:hypothetical protein
MEIKCNQISLFSREVWQVDRTGNGRAKKYIQLGETVLIFLFNFTNFIQTPLAGN